MNIGGEMAESDVIELEETSEPEIDPVEPQNRKIYTDPSDSQVDALYGKFKRGKLIVQGDFQRQFVWDSGKASRLVESIFLSIPIPMIYISEERDNKEYVIDGQQRLTSLFSFIDGKLPQASGDFKLQGLKAFPELNGHKFTELSESFQDKIRYFSIRTITFKKESDPNLKFEIFERLN